MEYIKTKIKGITLTLAFLLVGLQLIVGSILDLVFGLLIIGLLFLTLSVKT